MEHLIEFVTSVVNADPETLLRQVLLTCLVVMAFSGFMLVILDDLRTPPAGTQPGLPPLPASSPETASSAPESGITTRRYRPQRFCLVCGRELKEAEIHGH